jgi:hypothetical protein
VDQPDYQAEHHDEGRLGLGQRQDQAQAGQGWLVSTDAVQGQRQAEEQHEAGVLADQAGITEQDAGEGEGCPAELAFD